MQSNLPAFAAVRMLGLATNRVISGRRRYLSCCFNVSAANARDARGRDNSGCRSAHSQPVATAPEAAYPVHRVKVATCGDLYLKWKKEGKKKYRFAPERGLIVDIEYADTKALVGPHPEFTVLGLPGSPGSHQVYAPLINHLTSKLGARVIVPNFPDYSLTRKYNFFTHSTEEKTAYVKDFLAAIGVNKLDLVMGYSIGGFPTLQLKRETGLEVGSVALFNPMGHMKSPQVFWSTTLTVKMNENFVGRFLWRNIAASLLRLIRNPIKTDDMDIPLMMLTTLAYSSHQKMGETLEWMKANRVPLLLVFSDDDSLIKKEVFHEMVTRLGRDVDQVTIFDEKRQLLRQGVTSPDDWLLTILRFPSGGHYTFIKHQNTVNDAVVGHLLSLKRLRH